MVLFLKRKMKLHPINKKHSSELTISYIITSQDNDYIVQQLELNHAFSSNSNVPRADFDDNYFDPPLGIEI